MSRIILALALASSVSALLLPARVPGNKVRGDCSGAGGVLLPRGAAAVSTASVRSRPLYMSIDPGALTKIAAAGYSAGFSDGQNAAAIAGETKVEGPSALVMPEKRSLRSTVKQMSG